MMKLKDLKDTYTEDELSYFPGDRELRCRIFAPFLENLSGQKAIYHEKFVAVVEVSDVEVTAEHFVAVATIVLHVEQKGRSLFPPRRPWRFGGKWEHMMLSGNHFHVPYVGWSIWPEAELVKKVETLVLNGEFGKALAMSVYDDCD